MVGPNNLPPDKNTNALGPTAPTSAFQALLTDWAAR